MIIAGKSGGIISRYASHCGAAWAVLFLRTLLVKCVADDVEGLHVDMTVHDYVFHLLFTPKPRPFADVPYRLNPWLRTRATSAARAQSACSPAMLG